MSTNYAAFLAGHKKKPLSVREAEDRYADENEIVIKNAAVAMNQLDWKMQDTPWAMFKYPLILGVDVAGEVVEVGSDVTRFSIGDRVLGHALSFITEDERHGGFQNYTVLFSNMASPIPPSLPFESAAVLPLGVSTASAALFHEDGLALPKPSLNPTKTSTTVLIWGGTSSVGSNAIQLAVAAGCDVIVTASPRNFAAAKRLGADHVVDYNDASVIDKLKEAFRGKKLAGALDAIGTEKTFKQTSEAVSQVDGVKTVTSTIDDLEDAWVPPGVTGKAILAVSIRGLEGEDMDKNVGKMVYEDFLPDALKAGRYSIAPDPLVAGKGLGAIQDALETSKRTLGKKVVVSI
ncbi:oxidoreductase [Blastomyces dermatitidis ER-3]|uniref:Oxidoreductase n=1 Tax=Ajellomyces dermatitidis (strain ER-3 / ATCC MYA-2586) TaxID=559297 RepID=A0ABM9YFY6_AJEDR|nr:oxidoreductase [Blastomyces dermatitidis ER-3]EEQ85047.1 oxidoreductase [Blastomyces dermatitidis ER-3]